MPTYFVKKKVVARNLAEAIKKERNTPPSEIWLDNDAPVNQLNPAIGFSNERQKSKTNA